MGFAWKCPVLLHEKFYVFTVLRFGLSTVPYIFTKLIKPLAKHWRYLNINIAIFLDDGWSLAKDLQLCCTNSNTVKQDLLSAGFIPHDNKSIWEPTQMLDWLGLQWNKREGNINIVSRNIEKIGCTFTGQIISTGAVIGNVARIMTRHCSHVCC